MASVSWSRIDSSTRAGIANFAGALALGQSELTCNSVNFNGEGVDDATYAFENLGDVWCGCGGERVTCQVLSTGLVAPIPVGR